MANPNSESVIQPQAVKSESLLSKKSKTNALTRNGRYRCDTNIDRLTVEFQVDSPILGKASFRYIQVRHDFQSRDHRGLKHFDIRRNGDFVKNTIDAIANLQIVLQRFDVNVRRPLFERFPENLVYEFNDG